MSTRTIPTWDQDIEALIEWVRKDPKLLTKEASLSPEEREVLELVLETGGDRKAIAERLGPLRVTQLRAAGLGAPAPTEEASKVWSVLRTPLPTSWMPSVAPEALAQAFLDRYGRELDALGAQATAASSAAAALAQTLRGLNASKGLLKAVASLKHQTERLAEAAHTCTHPGPDGGLWARQILELTRESARAVDLVRDLGKVRDLGARWKEVADALREWADAPASQQAATADGMAIRLRAARQAALGLRKDLAHIVLGAPKAVAGD
jgi:hypothetical protein